VTSAVLGVDHENKAPRPLFQSVPVFLDISQITWNLKKHLGTSKKRLGLGPLRSHFAKRFAIMFHTNLPVVPGQAGAEVSGVWQVSVGKTADKNVASKTHNNDNI